MRLRVNPNGYSANAHLSAFIALEYGENDEELTWPFRGEVTVELLNQLNDIRHHSYTCHFRDTTPSDCTNRVTTLHGMNTGWGDPKFISHKGPRKSAS